MRIENLVVTPGIVTADVEDEAIVLAAPTISRGIWAAIDATASNLAQTLEHTWEEPLWPESVTGSGSPDAIEALRRVVEGDRTLLLRWRGYGEESSDAGDAWTGAPLPELPATARRPPSSVPKRFGSAGIPYGGADLVEGLVRVYDAF